MTKQTQVFSTFVFHGFVGKVILASGGSENHLGADVLEQSDDAVIAAARFPRPQDRVMDRLDGDGSGDLPSDAELAEQGIDRVTLARELSAGMDPRLFTRALELGLDVEAFNNRPYSGDRCEFNGMLETYIEHARLSRRYRRPENRSLARHGACI